MPEKQKPFVCRWGIVGSGSISSKFASDLALDPAGRDVSDVAHALTVIGSRDTSKAEKFIQDAAPHGGHAQVSGLYVHKPRAVGSYEQVYSDVEVDIVYIGVPHPFHFATAKAALEAGKGVLLEKPATLNVREAKILIDLAKERGLFFMEAIWTRFFPLAYRFQELLHIERAIGDVHHVLVDFGMAAYHAYPESHRLFSPELAGGAQLDIGPYTMLYALLALHEHPENGRAPPSKIACSMLPHPKTGVDLFSNMTLDFDQLKARADLNCNNMVPTMSDACVRVVGTEGELLVLHSPARPKALIVRKNKATSPSGKMQMHEYDERKEEFPIQGTGLHWEADAVARLLRDGKTTSDRCPPEITLLGMELMDKWREQVGYKYPAGLEQA